MNAEFVRKWREERGYQINAWTIDKIEEKQWMSQWKVAYMTNCTDPQKDCYVSETDQLQPQEYQKWKWKEIKESSL